MIQSSPKITVSDALPTKSGRSEETSSGPLKPKKEAGGFTQILRGLLGESKGGSKDLKALGSEKKFESKEVKSVNSVGKDDGDDLILGKNEGKGTADQSAQNRKKINPKAPEASKVALNSNPTKLTTPSIKNVGIEKALSMKEENQGGMENLRAKNKADGLDKKKGPNSDLTLDSSGSALSAIFQSGPHPGIRGSAVKGAEQKTASQEDGEIKVGGRKRDRKAERVVLELHDQRTHTAGGATSVKDRSVGLEDLSSRRNESEIVVELRSSSSGDGSQTAKSTKNSSNFIDLLSKELKNELNADIVRHASLVLKDGGEGLIRLNLKPDTLGAVKIRLEMAENKIAGHIIVESEEALRAFEKEIESLEQAFRDGGFDGASLELAVSSDSERGGQGREQQGSSKPFYSQRLAATDYDGASESIQDVSAYGQDAPRGILDMLA